MTMYLKTRKRGECPHCKHKGYLDRIKSSGAEECVVMNRSLIKTVAMEESMTKIFFCNHCHTEYAEVYLLLLDEDDVDETVEI